MHRFPLIVSCLLVVGACDSDGPPDSVETEASTATAASSGGAEGDAGGSTTTQSPTGATSAGETSATNESGEDSTSPDSTTGVTSGSQTSVDAGGSDESTGGLVPQLPPGDVDSVIAWLQGGGYEDWEAESGIHASDGPHFGNVRTFFNNVLVDSFEGGGAVHPIGAANVKELYGPGRTIRGWSLMVKREADAGQWYWFEVWDGDVLADTVAWDVCEDCHGDGVDNVLTPWPLQ